MTMKSTSRGNGNKIHLTDILGRFTNSKLFNNSIAFDVEIVGRDGRSVIYTHGYTSGNGKYTPVFLAKENGETKDFYLLGCVPCKQWLMTGKIE